MVKTYWEVGRLIVEEEQRGEKRSTYGKQQIKSLSSHLQKEFGKGFNERNLRNMRSFYVLYPIWQAVSAKLSWSHYCILLRVKSRQAREWYMTEAIENAWSVRALDRQIDKLYYERLLMSNDKNPVTEEAENHTKKLQIEAKNYLRDPYILDFLNLPYQPLLENELEKNLINNLNNFCLNLEKALHLLSVNSELRQTIKIFIST